MTPNLPDWARLDFIKGAILSSILDASSDARPRRSVEIYEEEVPETRVAQDQLAKAHFVGHDGPLRYYIPQMRKVEGFDHVGGIEKVIIGGEQAPTEDDKVKRGGRLGE